MHSIDVHDLPEPIAEAVAATVNALREQLNRNGSGKPDWSAWSLGTIGALDRNELYEDYLAQKLNPGAS